jgi:hypothetical protein
MSDLIEQIRQLTERVQNLTNHENNSDPISKFKRNHNVPVNIQSIHEGNSKCLCEVSYSPSYIKFDIFIDDVLDNDISNLSFKLTDFDLKVTNTEILGTILQDDNILRIEKISLIYSSTEKNYMLNIHSDEPFNAGKIFLAFSTLVSFSNYDSHVLCLDGPGTGGCCRPTMNINKIINPFM